MQRRVHINAFLTDAIGDVLTERVRSVAVFVNAVDDHIHIGIERVCDALRRHAMSCGKLPEFMGFVGDSHQFFDGERRLQGERCASRAACRCDLDVVGPFFDELTSHRTGLVRPCNLRPEVAHMATDDRHRPAAQDHSWSDRDALIYRVSQPEHRIVFGAIFPDRGNARIQA